MYLKEKLLKILKIKNVIFICLAIFGIVVSVFNIISLMSHYGNDWETILSARSMPANITSLIVDAVLITESLVSRRFIGNAALFSGYFETDLDGYVSFADLAAVTGKSEKSVNRQLRLFRKLYMKGFELRENQAVLDSKTCLCECQSCGGVIEKRVYFTGVCPYCGSSDLFAAVLTGNRFYSITKNVSEETKQPQYYAAKNLTARKVLFCVLLCVMLSLAVILTMYGISCIANYNNKEYLKKILLSGKSYSSFDLIKKSIADDIIMSSIIVAACVPVIINCVKKIKRNITANECSGYFAKSRTPFVYANKLPTVNRSKNKATAMKSVRGAMRLRYLKNCAFDYHAKSLRIALGAKVVKDRCPYCNGAITRAVDVNYTCQYCGRVIMNVLDKK